jgi:hypothetical protein
VIDPTSSTTDAVRCEQIGRENGVVTKPLTSSDHSRSTGFFLTLEIDDPKFKGRVR